MKLRSNRFLILLLILVFFSLTTEAQKKGSDPNTKNSDDCISYVFAKMEDFNRFKFRSGEAVGSAERQIKNFLKRCPDSQFQALAKEQLKVIQEEISNSRLYVAKYYLKRFEESDKGLIGARARLTQIVEKYPHYSKMDEVLYLLVKAYVLEKKPDEAERIYRRLLSEFYLSRYICEANILMRQETL